MFWKFDYLQTESCIDNLLSKENVTLFEILDEDDVLQECKAPNEKLVEFLVRADNMSELVDMIITEPPIDNDEKHRFKYPNIACEILTSDVKLINEKLADEEIFLKLWAFMDSEPPLNPLLASFFSKVMAILLTRETAKTVEFIKSRNDVIDTFLRHLNTSAIMDLLLRLVTCVEPGDIRAELLTWLNVSSPESGDLRIELLTWLNNHQLIQKLLNLLTPTHSEEKQSNAAQVLCDIVRLGREHILQCENNIEDPLLNTLENEETIATLCETFLSEDDKSTTSIVHGINVLLVLIEIKKLVPCIGDNSDQMSVTDYERLSRGLEPVLNAIRPRLNLLHNILTDPPKQPPVPTTVGALDPPLGNARLQVCKLIAAVISINNSSMNRGLAEQGILNTLWSLFMKYVWNNFLHLQVERCFTAVLTNPPPEGEEKGEHPLLYNLLKNCKLIEWSIDAWEENTQIELQAGGRRRGFMGHLNRIVNIITENSEKGPNAERITTLIGDLPDEYQQSWHNLVTGAVSEQNKKNITELGGSHPGQSSSDDEDVQFTSITFPQEPHLQQAFNDYQMQQMTSNFIDQFGFNDSDFTGHEDNVNHPFDKLNDINFSIAANEDGPNAAMFEACCNERIQGFDDSGSDDDMWEEKQLTFSSATQSRESTGTDGLSKSDDVKQSSLRRRGSSDSSSDSDEDSESGAGTGDSSTFNLRVAGVTALSDDTRHGLQDDMKMDIDNNESWTAAFGQQKPDDMEVVNVSTTTTTTCSNNNNLVSDVVDKGDRWAQFNEDQSDLPTSAWTPSFSSKTSTINNPPSPAEKTVNGNWASFDDFFRSSSNEQRCSSPVAMETTENNVVDNNRVAVYLSASSPADIAPVSVSTTTTTTDDSSEIAMCDTASVSLTPQALSTFIDKDISMDDVKFDSVRNQVSPSSGPQQPAAAAPINTPTPVPASDINVVVTSQGLSPVGVRTEGQITELQPALPLSPEQQNIGASVTPPPPTHVKQAWSPTPIQSLSQPQPSGVVPPRNTVVTSTRPGSPPLRQADNNNQSSPFQNSNNSVTTQFQTPPGDGVQVNDQDDGSTPKRWADPVKPKIPLKNNVLNATAPVVPVSVSLPTDTKPWITAPPGGANRRSAWSGTPASPSKTTGSNQSEPVSNCSTQDNSISDTSPALRDSPGLPGDPPSPRSTTNTQNPQVPPTQATTNDSELSDSIYNLSDNYMFLSSGMMKLSEDNSTDLVSGNSAKHCKSIEEARLDAQIAMEEYQSSTMRNGPS